MPDDLYWNDILTWSAQQADRLRRLRAGERVNDLDWDNIIEEIETLGRSEVSAAESLLAQSVLHLLKVKAWPGSSAARKWRSDAGDFLVQARRLYRPSMAQRIDLRGVLDYALQRFEALRHYAPQQPLPTLGSIPLAALADRAFTLEELEAALFPSG